LSLKLEETISFEIAGARTNEANGFSGVVEPFALEMQALNSISRCRLLQTQDLRFYSRRSIEFESHGNAALSFKLNAAIQCGWLPLTNPLLETEGFCLGSGGLKLEKSSVTAHNFRWLKIPLQEIMGKKEMKACR